MTQPPRRPLLPVEDRKRLRRMADTAEGHAQSETSTLRAYAHGVADVLHWLDGGDMTALLREAIR